MTAFLETATQGWTLPRGCTNWGFRLNRAGGLTSHGFVWPREGWVDAPGPFSDDNDSACPDSPGDGICAARTWRGVWLNYQPAEIMLVAWSSEDVLGGQTSKVRLRRAYVVTVMDLYDANLTGADLSGADLIRADLQRARLRDADLSNANLSGADLYDANLYGANLYSANLTGANLTGANLRRANLRYADLTGANLTGADLTGADLTGVHGFNPQGSI